MKITLTFDNGPDPVGTPLILDALTKHGVKAVFFMLGAQLAQPELMKLAEEVVRNGHRVGNHTFSHNEALGLMADQDAALREIEDTAALLAPLAGSSRLFRPVGKQGQIGPHILSPVTWAHLAEKRYDCLLWNCLALDWEREETWVEPTLADVTERDWSVVVLHDICTTAMQHVDRFIGALKERGAEFTQEFPDDCVVMRKGVVTKVGETLRAANGVPQI